MTKEVNRFSPDKYKKREEYAEVRPGVKVCDRPECGEEFHYDPEKHKVNHVWRFKRYCSERCQRIVKSRMERARLLKDHGNTNYYKILAQERLNEKRIAEANKTPPRKNQGSGWYGMVSHKQLGPKTLSLPPLPPEARTRTLAQAFRAAMRQHEDFLPVLDEAYKEQRGFRARVHREMKAARAAARNA